MAQLDPVQPFIGGLGFEIGRAFLWRAEDDAKTDLDGDGLRRRLGLPPVPRVTAALQDWRDALGRVDGLHLLDLAYIEQRMGPWAYAAFPSDPSVVRYAPAITRLSLDAMLSMPPAFRRDDRLGEALIARAWPALSDIPFNSEGWLRDKLRLVSRGLREPSTVIRKMRKLS